MRLSAVSVESLPSGQTWARICKGRVNDTLYDLSPGHIRHPSTVRSVCGRKPWVSQHRIAGASRSWRQPYRS